MRKRFEDFKQFWEKYNGFALIALILGILCFFFGWFRRSIYYMSEFSHYEYKYLIELFYYDFHTALFGLLYLLGLVFLIFYYSGVILNNHGDFGTPMEKHSNTFFKLSVIIFIAFEILMYLHFINPPYFPSGWFSFFWDWRYVSDWKLHTGFYLGVIMICMVLVSFIYDKLMLRRHYEQYLPEHAPKKYQEIEETDDETKEVTILG